MTLIQNIALGLAYIVGIPVIGACGVAALYYFNGQKSKLNFRLRGEKKPNEGSDGL
jgi:hypothetical protein